MKKNRLALRMVMVSLFWMLVQSMHAQSPQSIPYQAVVRNADGSVMSNAAMTMIFKIHNATATGDVVYQESHSTASNAQGLVVLNVGQGQATVGTFNNINWGSGAKFMHVVMNAGNGEVDLGTQQMMSVPYALYSLSADNAVNASNGFSHVSITGDTLFMSNGIYIIIPGVSLANYPVLGCTNYNACNYNPSATLDDGSCVIQGASCNDGNANTYYDFVFPNCQCDGFLSCSTQSISVTGCGGQTSLTYDGRTYDLVEIGGQCWFADNLATDQYRNGDLIPTGLDNDSWSLTSGGAYAIYNNDPANDVTYGKLYNWYTTVDTRGLCPTGWHVPTDCEWMYLEGSLGMSVADQESLEPRGTNQGGDLKATTNWNSPNTGATNSSGFTALPGGYRSYDGTYNAIGIFGKWWSIRDSDFYSAFYRGLSYADSKVIRGYFFKSFGYSVRCVRD